MKKGQKLLLGLREALESGHIGRLQWVTKIWPVRELSTKPKQNHIPSD